MNKLWKVSYGCDKWKDSEEGLTEREARKRYETYCRKLPLRGGVPAKFIALYDNGNYIAGFASGGSYGKVS